MTKSIIFFVVPIKEGLQVSLKVNKEKKVEIYLAIGSNDQGRFDHRRLIFSKTLPECDLQQVSTDDAPH